MLHGVSVDSSVEAGTQAYRPAKWRFFLKNASIRSMQTGWQNYSHGLSRRIRLDPCHEALIRVRWAMPISVRTVCK